RHHRIDRVREMIGRLASLGIELDADAILRPALDAPNKAVGRPSIARALVERGHVATVSDAFDAWLSPGRPAFVLPLGASPRDVFERIHEAGGIASLAHPGLLGLDDRLPQLAADGLDALEAYHTDHDA